MALISSRNFKKGQAYCGNALRCLGWIIERTTQVEEPGLESVIADLLYLAEHLEKRIRLLGIDRPGVRLCSEFDNRVFPFCIRQTTDGREGPNETAAKAWMTSRRLFMKYLMRAAQS